MKTEVAKTIFQSEDYGLEDHTLTVIRLSNLMRMVTQWLLSSSLTLSTRWITPRYSTIHYMQIE